MKNQDTEQKIRTAFEKATPNVLASVLSDCREQKGTVIVMKEKKKNWGLKLAATAAVLALVVTAGIGFGIYRTNNTVYSTISLDVNPSIEIQVNSREKVLEVNALNSDGDIILDDMDLTGSDMNVAVNAIIGSMLRNGYITELSNSILVSVNSKDPAQSAALQKELTSRIANMVDSESFSAAVIGQTVTEDAALQKLADKNHISLGKAKLISSIIAQDSRYTFDELAGLSVNELTLISESATIKLKNVSTVGNASDKDYIGRDAALEAALTQVGATKDQITDLEMEMDYEAGQMCYEVEFCHKGTEYDCTVHAKNGQILHSHQELCDDHGGTHNEEHHSGHHGTSGTYITPEAAQNAAFTHAGVSSADVRGLECELDTDDGIAHYEIEFKVGNYEYSYDIAATDGKVLDSEKEYD